MNDLKFEMMKQDEIEESAMLTVRAFEDYNYMVNYMADSDRRRKFLEITMPIELKINHEAINVVVKKDNRIVAVATIYRPGGKKVNDIEYFKAGMIKAFLAGGIIDVCAWVNMDKHASTPCHTLKKDAWYVNMITVEPEFQGKGIGSKLINDFIVPYVKDNGGKEVSLFTNNDRNKKFYAKNGFTEFDYKEFSYKGTKMPNYSMVRKV
ncbi:MAG: GNAT family N-acetyltransferase [Lachnospiraceae bacterium]|nr:GNAT family N-acetyltransferase [Lachnospiraceae bacterium]